MLEDLQDYGLVYQRKVPVNHCRHCRLSLTSSCQQTPNRIYPTRLATTLTTNAPNLTSSNSATTGPAQGFIILETNYRLYAYTGSMYFALTYRRKLTTRYHRQSSPNCHLEPVRHYEGQISESCHWGDYTREREESVG